MYFDKYKVLTDILVKIDIIILSIEGDTSENTQEYIVLYYLKGVVNMSKKVDNYNIFSFPVVCFSV